MPGVANSLVWLRTDRWVPLLFWLSLDVVRPRWSRAGFHCAGKQQEAWIGLLRRLILRAIGAARADPRAPWTLVTDVLTTATAELGEAASSSLLRFGRFTFAMGPYDHPELFAWRTILDRCELDATKLDALVPWTELRGPLAERLHRARADAVREELLLPLSSWDVAMLALRGIDDADPSAPEHPLRLVEWTIRVASSRALLRAILPLLDDDRRDALTWNGTRLGWTLGTLAPDASLPDPETLVDHD